MMAAVSGDSDAVICTRLPALDAIGERVPWGCNERAALQREEVMSAGAKLAQHAGPRALQAACMYIQHPSGHPIQSCFSPAISGLPQWAKESPSRASVEANEYSAS